MYIYIYECVYVVIRYTALAASTAERGVGRSIINGGKKDNMTMERKKDVCVCVLCAPCARVRVSYKRIFIYNITYYMYIRDGRAHQHALTTNTRTHSRTNAHIIYTRTYAHTRTPHAQRTYVIYSVYVRVCARAYVPCASLLLRCVQWCVLAHELFARGPTDFEITPSDWPALAVYIKSANGSRATGRVPRTPCSPRYVIQQYCRPTDIHTSICQVFIYALFFFIIFFYSFLFTISHFVILLLPS